MKEIKTYQEMEADLNNIIAKCQYPDYLIDHWFDGELYFNPNCNCGFYWRFDSEYNVPIHTWFPNVIKLLYFISDVNLNILHTSPDLLYHKIKDLYIQNNVPIPKFFYRFENLYIKNKAGHF